jgi:wyosine [tRNA(Phe)-imidazoG37] synthetase (radical SAM superfamily)
MNGEPLLEKRLNSFSDYLIDYPYYGILDSNATTKSNLDSLIHPFINVIRISLSAHNKELYEKIHGFNMFNRVINNLHYIKENKLDYQYLQINHMICKYNYKYVDDFTDMFKGFNITLYPLHDGITQKSSKLSNVPNDKRIINENINIYENGKKEKAWSRLNYKGCQCWDLLGIGLHGEIMHCVDYPEYINYGTIYDRNIKEAWIEKINNNKYPNICKNCNLWLE